MKSSFGVFFLLFVKVEAFIIFRRDELQEEINIANETSELHKLWEEMIQ